MNELMNKVMAIRDEIGDAWKTTNTLDCLRAAAKSANELRYLWMWQQNPDHTRHNERDDSMAQELADTVIMLLTAAHQLEVDPSWAGRFRSGNKFDYLCFHIEGAVITLSKMDVIHGLTDSTAIKDELGLNLDDIVKARLKDIARRNGFDVGIVDKVWLKDNKLC